MTYIPVKFEEIEEQKPVPQGQYELQITGAQATETGENSKHPGTPMIRVTLQFTDLELNAPAVNHFLTFPYEGDDNAAFKWLQIKRFLVAFGADVPTEGVDLESMAMDLVSRVATVEVTLTEPNENGDIFNRLRVPRLPSENSQKAAKSRRRA